MPEEVGVDTVLEGTLPAQAANYSSLAVHAAKTQSDWETELTTAETDRWGDSGVLGGLFEGLSQGKPFIAALIEAIIHRIFPALDDAFDNAEDAFAALGEAFQDRWDTFGQLMSDLADNPDEVIGSAQNILVDGESSFSQWLTDLWQALTKQTGTGKSAADVVVAAELLKDKVDTGYSNADDALDFTGDILSSGSNLIKNSSFENIFFQQLGSVFSATYARTGTKSLLLTGNGATTVKYRLLSTDSTPRNISVSEGDIFYAEVFVRGKPFQQSSGDAGSIRMVFQPYNASNTALDTAVFFTSPSTTLNSGWQKLAGYVPMPAGSRYLVITLELDNTINSGTQIWWDDVVVREVTLASAASATADEALGLAEGADGKADGAQEAADAAQEAADTADGKATDAGALALEVISSGSNLIKNSSFENIFFQQFGSVFTFAQKRSGSKSLMLTATGSSTVSYVLLSDDSQQRFLTVGGGDILSAEVWVRGSSTQTSGGTDGIRMFFEPFNASGTALTTQQVAMNASTAYNSTWHQLSGYVTMPAGTVKVRVSIELTSAVKALDSWFFDDVTVREVTLGKAGVDAADVAASAALTADGKAIAINQALYAQDTPGSVVLESKVQNLTTVKNTAVDLYSRVDQYIAGGANLCTNPSFEDITQYLDSGTYYASGHSGTRSAKLTGTGVEIYAELSSNKTGPIYQMSGPSRTYSIEYWIYGGSANTLTGSTVVASVGVYAYTASQSYVTAQSVNVTAATVGKNDWVKVTGIVTLASTATIATIRLLATIPAVVDAPNVFYFDDIRIVDITEAYAASSAASTADGKAQSTLDGIVQSVAGGSSTYSPADVKTSLLDAWTEFWKGLTGATGSNKRPGDVNSAAAGVRLSASDANTSAGTANGRAIAINQALYAQDTPGSVVLESKVQNLTTVKNTANSAATQVVDTNTAIYNNFYGSGGTGIATEVGSTVAAIKTAIAGGWTVETLTTSGTWTRPVATAQIIDFWAICIGGGGGGGNGVSSGICEGGSPGGYVAQQINPADIGSTVSYTVGSGASGRSAGGSDRTATPPTTTSFGALASTANVGTASIASVVGYYDATASAPGAGGSTPSLSASTVANGVAGRATPLASGGAGGTSGSPAGGTGGTASLTGQTRAGGGGGGSGYCYGSGTQTGGTGGNGGFPGGGGGAGGKVYTGTNGAGGNGGNGVIILIFKVAE